MMRLAAIVVFVALVTGACTVPERGSGAAETRCKRGELHVVSGGHPRCLTKAQRRKIFVALVRLRDAGYGERAYTIIARRFRLSLAVIRLIAAEGARRGLPPAPRLPRGVAVTAAGGPGAATELDSSITCSSTEKGLAVATLRWQAAVKRGSSQRVVVSIYFRGLEQGRLEASAPLSPKRHAFAWYRVHGRAVHYWRVLTRHSDGWHASKTVTFTGPTCLSGR
jgi:hypothetical protein